jgi:hypothetical protein
MRVSTEKAGVAKVRLVGGKVIEFTGCVVHGDQLVEANGSGMESVSRVSSISDWGA